MVGIYRTHAVLKQHEIFILGSVGCVRVAGRSRSPARRAPVRAGPDGMIWTVWSNTRKISIPRFSLVAFHIPASHAARVGPAPLHALAPDARRRSNSDIGRLSKSLLNVAHKSLRFRATCGRQPAAIAPAMVTMGLVSLVSAFAHRRRDIKRLFALPRSNMGIIVSLRRGPLANSDFGPW
jgi:hypothetical protein